MNPQELQGALKAVRIEHHGSFVPEEAAQTLKYIFKGNQVALMESHKKTGAGTICQVRPRRPRPWISPSRKAQRVARKYWGYTKSK